MPATSRSGIGGYGCLTAETPWSRTHAARGSVTARGHAFDTYANVVDAVPARLGWLESWLYCV
jgi:hypothetical protein